VALPGLAAATAGPTAANPPRIAVAGEWDRQTDGHRTVS